MAAAEQGTQQIPTVAMDEVAPGSNGRPAGRTGRIVATRPQRRLTQAELDWFLEKAADLLRGGVDHSEFGGYVFALLACELVRRQKAPNSDRNTAIGDLDGAMFKSTNIAAFNGGITHGARCC